MSLGGSSTAQVGVERADPVLRELRRHAGEATARAVLPCLRECCLGSGHPVGQLAVEGRRCCLRRQPCDLLPLGAGGIDSNRPGPPRRGPSFPSLPRHVARRMAARPTPVNALTVTYAMTPLLEEFGRAPKRVDFWSRAHEVGAGSSPADPRDHLLADGVGHPLHRRGGISRQGLTGTEAGTLDPVDNEGPGQAIEHAGQLDRLREAEVVGRGAGKTPSGSFSGGRVDAADVPRGRSLEETASTSQSGSGRPAHASISDCRLPLLARARPRRPAGFLSEGTGHRARPAASPFGTAFPTPINPQRRSTSSPQKVRRARDAGIVVPDRVLAERARASVRGLWSERSTRGPQVLLDRPLVL